MAVGGSPADRPVASAGGRGFLGSRFSPLFSVVVVTIVAFSSAVVVILVLRTASERALARARTLVGHNLDPTPWHPFAHDKPRPSAYAAFRCASYLSCIASGTASDATPPSGNRRQCPAFFAAIHRDLAPWRGRRITRALLDAASARAAMRVVITGGGRHVFVDLYYACVQSRALFTVWGLLQLTRRYPGMVPDVDLMFDCMDRPAINRPEYRMGTDNDAPPPPPPPLFRYCTTREHFDVPFPDWSFWGWPEVNIKPWDQQFRSIKIGAEAVEWKNRAKTAYWKGNPDVQSPVRMALLSCNDSETWRAQIMRQDWTQESSSGFQNSNLANQCNHRYKIYAEGFAWSVSLKYILSCGSLALIIDPQYEDFFSRGLIPKVNFWPVSPINLCESIKSVVDWGNSNPSEAEAVGRRGQNLMQDLDMNHVYDYMFHLLLEYSKLLDFKPTPPPSAQEVCLDSLLCIADEKQRRFMQESYASPSPTQPCILPPHSGD